MTSEPRTDRIEPRIPFFTPVVASGLTGCWATNISSGGVGLTAFVTSATPPARGDELELELALGDTKQPLRVIGRVAWTTQVAPDGRNGLGVQFREMSPGDRAALALFLAEHRPRAIIALASDAEQALAASALPGLQLERVAAIDQLGEELLRDCASLVVFCHDAAQLTAFLDGIDARTESSLLPPILPLAPITLCTSVDAELLVPLVTNGRIYQVLRPPFDEETLELAVGRSCEKWALQVELRWASLQLAGLAVGPPRAAGPVPTDPSRHPASVVRESAAMQRVYELIATVAVHDVPVLLIGETGTGKELAARAIHALSKRAHTPFVAQDCGALTETLLESELFGHMRGAFTGATSDHPGLFQIADGGTIFLDEIQNTSPTLQAKLLRVVEQGEVRPVGSAKPRRVDVRVIAACNVDLRQAVKDQRFRSDFFFRLNRFPIELPPLRDHPDDVLPLTRYFVATIAATMGRKPHRVDPRVEQALLTYDWPGNIRELRNVIERALLLTPPEEPLRWETLPDEVRAGAEQERVADRGLDAQVDEFERRIIKIALERHEGVVRRAARDLAVNAVTLARKMRKLGL